MDLNWIDKLFDEFLRKLRPWGILWKKLVEIFGMDLRSLAVYRIGVAVVVLADIWNRSNDIREHYSDDGLLPRSTALQYWWNWNWLCVHMISGKAFVQYILFSIHALFTLSFLVGYRTFLCNLIVWFMVISIQARNYLVGHGGDIVLRMYLFWGLFLPLGKLYSIDAFLAGKDEKTLESIEEENARKIQEPKSDYHYQYDHDPSYYNSRQFAPLKGSQRMLQRKMVINGGTISLLCQFCLLYAFSYLHKTAPEWTIDNTATFYALQLDYFRKPFGSFLLQCPDALLRFLTWTVLLWEGYGCICFFLPFWTAYFHMFGVIGFFMMHIGFQLSMRLGIFGWICAFGPLCLLPSWFWDVLIFPYLHRKERIELLILYRDSDPPQRTCKSQKHYSYPLWARSFARFFRYFFLLQETKIVSLETTIESGKILEKEVSDVTDLENASYERTFAQALNIADDVWLATRERNGTVQVNYNAVITLFKLSPLLWPFRYLLSTTIATYIGRVWIPEVYLFFQSILSDDNSDRQHRIRKYFDRPRNGRRYRSPQKRAWKMVLKTTVQVITFFFAFLCLFICFCWCMDTSGRQFYSLPSELSNLGLLLHLDQSWGMFSPRPPSVHWWYIIDGRLENDTEIEIFKNEGIFNWQGNVPVTWEKPEPFHLSFRSHRWFKFFEMMNFNEHNREIRELFAKYICREWNWRHLEPEKLYTFTIYWMNEVQNLDGTRSPVPKQALWEHFCYTK